MILSNPGQVICQILAFQSRDVCGTKQIDFEIYARSCSDTVSYQQCASISQQMIHRNSFKKLKMVHLHISVAYTCIATVIAVKAMAETLLPIVSDQEQP